MLCLMSVSPFFGVPHGFGGFVCCVGSADGMSGV